MSDSPLTDEERRAMIESIDSMEKRTNEMLGEVRSMLDALGDEDEEAA